MNSIIRHLRSSLSLRLSLGILLITIPVFVISLGVLFLQSRYNIKQSAHERASGVLNTTMHRLDRYLKTVETATEANAWYVLEHMQPDSLLAQTARVVALNGNISGCSITPEPNTFPQYGRYFSAYSIRRNDSIITEREGEYEYYEKPWYTLPRKQKRACWTDPFDDYNEGTLSAPEIIASYCKPLYNNIGHLVGVMTTDLLLSTITDAIYDEMPYPHAFFVLRGSTGQLLYCTDSTLNAAPPEVTAAIGDVKKNYVVSAGVAGTPWTLTLVCPERDMLQGYYRLSKILTPLLVVGLLLILLLCYCIVQRAIRPLKYLLRESQLIAAGQYDNSIPRSTRHDVVGRLQNSFQTMQESLDRHVRNIKKVNEETELRNKELVEASRMAEEAAKQKTTFIHNMTHQVRTPLNIIMGVAQLLGDVNGTLSKEEMGGLTTMMMRNVMTLRRMIQMLYDSSGLGMAEEMACYREETVSCNELVREVIAYTLNQFPEMDIVYETTLPDSMTIRTNYLYLMRSLREVLYNAAKYASGKKVMMRSKATVETVLFMVEDQGPGIAEEYREQVFVPFSKVNDLSEGLGLGLPLSRSHLKHLGGDLILDSSYTNGCRFLIELPLK